VFAAFKDFASARRVIREYFSFVIPSSSLFASAIITTKSSSFLLETCNSAPGYSSLSSDQVGGTVRRHRPLADAISFGAGGGVTRGALGARAHPGETATITAKTPRTPR